MAEPFLGEIRVVAFGFPPPNWAICNGALLSIVQYSALFSLLGTTYGGDGQSTFALPDLRGRIGIGSGQAPGLSNYDLGQQGGTESYPLQPSEMAPHYHLMDVATNDGTSNLPQQNYFAVPTTKEVNLYSQSPDGTASSLMIMPNDNGGGAHENRQSFLTMMYVIAMAGIYPPKN